MEFGSLHRSRSNSRSALPIYMGGVSRYTNPPPMGPFGYAGGIPGSIINASVGNIVNSSISNVGNDSSVRKAYCK